MVEALAVNAEATVNGQAEEHFEHEEKHQARSTLEEELVERVFG